MSTTSPVAKIPVAWLRPLPEGYKIPIWRWILLPATALMLKRSGGVWMSGELEITATALSFVQSRMVKTARAPMEKWEIPLDAISELTVQKGMTSETLVLEHSGRTTKFLTVRAGEFIELLRGAIDATDKSERASAPEQGEA